VLHVYKSTEMYILSLFAPFAKVMLFLASVAAEARGGSRVRGRESSMWSTSKMPSTFNCPLPSCTTSGSFDVREEQALDDIFNWAGFTIR